MNDWSDKEVNIKLLDLVNPGWRQQVDKILSMNESLKNGVTSIHHVTMPDYCNSWSDMGPLIVEHQITIAKCDGLDFWEAYAGGYGVDYDHRVYSDIDCNHDDPNPLRAAAICLIKKLEADNV